MTSLLFADDVFFLVSLSRYLQLSLERFTVACEVTWMRISTSKSKTIILSRKRAEFPPRVGSEVLCQVEDSQVSRFLFMSGVMKKQEVDRWIGKVKLL